MNSNENKHRLSQRLEKYKPVYSKLFKDKKPLLLFAAGIVGILLIVISEVTSGDKQTKGAGDSVQETVILNEYEDRLEAKLCETLEAIDGAGRVKVMLTIDCGEETVFAVDKIESNDKKTDEEKNSSSSNTKFEYEYIIIKSSGSAESGLALRVIQPKVRGVAVVCDGGTNPEVRLGIIQAVSAALALSSAKISVTGMTVE